MERVDSKTVAELARSLKKTKLKLLLIAVARPVPRKLCQLRMTSKWRLVAILKSPAFRALRKLRAPVRELILIPYVHILLLFCAGLPNYNMRAV